LAPGQSIDLSVVFTPTIAGSSSGSLTINLVGANNPANLPLNGSGANGSAPAQLAVLPSTLGFGSVTIGNSKNLTASLNATNSDVTVSSAAWNGSGYAVTGITFPTTVKAARAFPLRSHSLRKVQVRASATFLSSAMPQILLRAKTLRGAAHNLPSNTL